MIVVMGQPGDRDAGAIARAAAGAGAQVQFVSRIADDRAGDRTIQELASAGVGHVATLRQPPPATPLDPADLELALRYLDDVSVLVLCAPDAALARTGVGAAGWSRGRLIITVASGAQVPEGVPDAAIVLEAPASDPDGAFAAFVGDLATRLDGGGEPAAAFAATLADQPAWTPAAD
jgi:hypothetical protein